MTVVEVIVGAVAAAKSRRALVRGGSPQMVPRNGTTLLPRLLRSAPTMTLWAFPGFRTGFYLFFYCVIHCQFFAIFCTDMMISFLQDVTLGTRFIVRDRGDTDEDRSAGYFFTSEDNGNAVVVVRTTIDFAEEHEILTQSQPKRRPLLASFLLIIIPLLLLLLLTIIRGASTAAAASGLSNT